MISQDLEQYALSSEWQQSVTEISLRDELVGEITTEVQEEGGFVAKHSAYPGAIGQGETEQEAVLDLLDSVESIKDAQKTL